MLFNRSVQMPGANAIIVIWLQKFDDANNKWFGFKELNKDIITELTQIFKWKLFPGYMNTNRLS